MTIVGADPHPTCLQASGMEARLQERCTKLSTEAG